MDIFLTNNLTNKKEQFVPKDKKHIGMYVCGPTVYDDPHIGNARPIVIFDILFKVLKNKFSSVTYVRNITDVGHLEYDEDQGEDRISKKAKSESVEPMEIVQKYTLDFHETLSKFNLLPPNIEPTATGHIIDQIEFIKKIIKFV